MALVLILSVITHFLWKGIKNIDKKRSGQFGKYIFLGFLLLQIGILCLLIFVVPHLITRFSSGSIIYPLINLFANITLTYNLSKYTFWLGPTFWSLIPEIIFYMMFPFFIVPAIYVAKKWGFIMGLILVFVTTKIVLDLDRELLYQGKELIFYVGRGSGFIAGIVVGVNYQQRTKLWEKCEKLFLNIYIGIFALIAFIFTQWADFALNTSGPIVSNYFYLCSSWIIAFIVIGALVQGSIVQKIFSHRVFVFLGIISYSLYLTHPLGISWAVMILSPVQTHISHALYLGLLVLLGVGVSVILAWALYLIVDKLYFTYHKHLPEKIALKKENIINIIPSRNLPFFYSSLAAYGLIILFVFTGQYSGSLLIDKYSVVINHVKPFSSYSLLQGPIKIPFTAKNDNLGIIQMNLLYKRGPAEQIKFHNPSIQFRLLDGNNEIYISKRLVYYTDLESVFEFGFPPIPKSKGKHYTVELKLLGGNKDNQISINPLSTNFTTLSVIQKSPTRLLYVFLNRISYILTLPSSLFALLPIPILIVFT